MEFTECEVQLATDRRLRVMLATPPESNDPLVRAVADGSWQLTDALLWLLLNIQSGDRVLDLGAHIGTFTLLAARLGAKVTAVEASPGNAQLLSAATDANDLSDYVDVIQVAVTDEIGEVSFADYGPFGTIGTERLNEAAGLPMITVRATTIDSFSQTPYDWIKMDIEGAECAAISGGSRTLRQARGLAVESNGYMLGQHGSSVGDLLGALKRLGYCPYSAAGETLSPIRPRIFQPEATLDYIAVPAGGQPFLPDGWVRGTARSRSELLRALVSELGHPSPQHRACALSVARRAPLWARWTPALRQAVRTLDADSHPDVVYARGRWRRHA